jgi:hypothetical protein
LVKDKFLEMILYSLSPTQSDKANNQFPQVTSKQAVDKEVET